MNNLVKIGYTKKPHGLKGEIKLFIEERYLEDLMEAEVVVIDIKGKPTPYFIEDVRLGNHIIAKFEDVDSPDEALAIGSKELFLREQDILADDEREIEIEVLPYEHCVGYALFENDTLLGNIEEIVEYPQQEMALIIYKGREVLVPLNQAFVKQLDDIHKKIIVDLPEGMLDL